MWRGWEECERKDAAVASERRARRYNHDQWMLWERKARKLEAKLAEKEAEPEEPAADIEVGELWRCVKRKNNINLWESEWVEVRYVYPESVVWMSLQSGSGEFTLPRDEFLDRFEKTDYCRASK